MPKGLIYFILFFLTTNLYAQRSTFKAQLDSIQELRRLSKNQNLDLDKRMFYAEQANDLSHKTKVDSTVLRSRYNLAWHYMLDKKHSKESIRLNHKNLKLAYKLNDSVLIAYINMHLGYVHQNLGKSDSAYYYYYKSLRTFKDFDKLLNDDFDFLSQSVVLSNIAELQVGERDYVGGQASIIQGINILLTLPETEESLDNLWDLYNNLGRNLKSLKKDKKALEYYNKALSISAKMKNNFESQLFTKINIAELYRETGKYENVFKIYNELLEDKTLKKKDPSSYAAILNNIAYTMFLAKDKDYGKIDSLFTKAYNIFNDLELFYEISAGGNDMAEFYYANNQKHKAIFYSKKAYEYGKVANENSEVLRALKMLSKLKEGNEGKVYLYEYIKLNDSLIDVERVNRNKYARIQFETDQYIKETKRLTTQNILIFVIGSILVFVLGLLYFIKVQRTKNKALVYEQIQQEANQEIYALMLNQHEKLETGRLLERHRISEDLHDGILSKLFGTRMGFGFLEVEGDKETLKQHEQLQQELQSIEKEVRDVSHELKADSLSSKTSFETILENYVKQQSLIGNYKYNIKKEEKLLFETISNTIKVTIFRIVQEAIQNIIKHAKANMLTISFKEKENTLCMSIEDDGIGFDAKTKHKGIGLKNIESRVSKFGGTFNIISKPNQGTRVNISVPI